MQARLLVLLIACATLPGCSGRYTALKAGAAATKQQGVTTVGSGRYAYQLTLINPETEVPWPNRPYAITLNGYDFPFIDDEKDVLQGITNAFGQTDIIRMDARIPDTAWDMQERFGTGKFGERFRIMGPDDKILTGQPYVVAVCSDPPKYVRGYTDKTGKTAYVATQEPQNLVLHVGRHADSELQDSCKDEAAEYDPNNDPRFPRPAKP
jgi:hypothetical protein